MIAATTTIPNTPSVAPRETADSNRLPEAAKETPTARQPLTQVIEQNESWMRGYRSKGVRPIPAIPTDIRKPQNQTIILQEEGSTNVARAGQKNMP